MRQRRSENDRCGCNEEEKMLLPRPKFTDKTTPREIARFLVVLIEAIERKLAELEDKYEQ